MIRIKQVNIFILSLFGYLEQFCRIPEKGLVRLLQALVYFIWGMNLFKHELGTLLKQWGFGTALSSLEVRGQAARARCRLFTHEDT